MLQVVTENKSQKEVLFRNRPQRRQVQMIKDGKKDVFSHLFNGVLAHLNLRNAHG